ncbi:hypothetical protein [Kitasatospora azatica]|uniref:hypothetical protein n=1 Tax=Kitasatospora azatica TaxID=58347 RepID=UPI00055C316F|nr:hypothetical protein [Kitasatospora azatica]
MIDPGNAAAQRVLRLSRQTTSWGAGYLVLATAVLLGEAFLGLRYLVVSLVVAGALPVLIGGYLTVRNGIAAAELAKHSDIPARSDAWYAMTFVLTLLTVGGLATVAAQLRDDLVLRTPAVAVIDHCDQVGKGRTCAYHWTIDGRTYNADDNRVTDLATGTEVSVRYAPGEPSVVRPAGEYVTPGSILGAIVLLGGTAGLVPTVRRERQTRRGYFAQVAGRA